MSRGAFADVLQYAIAATIQIVHGNYVRAAIEQLEHSGCCSHA